MGSEMCIRDRGFLLYFEIEYFEIGMYGLGLWGITGALHMHESKKNK